MSIARLAGGFALYFVILFLGSGIAQALPWGAGGAERSPPPRGAWPRGPGVGSPGRCAA